jgi:hypothetical protein
MRKSKSIFKTTLSKDIMSKIKGGKKTMEVVPPPDPGTNN